MSAEAISRVVEMGKECCIYIMTNERHSTLYTGVTSDLKKRACQHREKLVDGFTKHYNLTKLVYYEVLDDIETALRGEKQIRAGSRQKQVQMINRMNGEWKDLYGEL
jgi:putative endonuclease